MTLIDELRRNLRPGLDAYELPDRMPAQVILPGKEESGRLHYREIAVPRIGKDEALVAIMAAGLNFNTVWSLRGEPVSSFELIKRLGLVAKTEESHIQPYHVPGSDASGFIVKLGTEDTRWKLGSEVVLNCNWHRNDDPLVFEDSLLSSEQRIWGYETNFGSFAAFAVVKLHQLMEKPRHLTWYEAASYSLVLSTAYRMLLTSHGVSVKPGQRVLIWGGSGGLGLSAIQLCQLAGAVPVPVVSSDEKGQSLTALGIHDYINRTNEKLDFWRNGSHNMLAWRNLKNIIQKRFGGAPNVVFEHPGRDTMAASVYALARGGKVVSCAATSGFDISYDHRYLWMESKSIIGSHFANASEAQAANNLVRDGKIRPFVSSVFSFENILGAVRKFESNAGFGKIVVGVLADPAATPLSSGTNLLPIAYE